MPTQERRSTFLRRSLTTFSRQWYFHQIVSLTFAFAANVRFSTFSLNWLIGLGVVDWFNGSDWDYLFESGNRDMTESF
jgi:hypothetical protein